MSMGGSADHDALEADLASVVDVRGLLEAEPATVAATAARRHGAVFASALMLVTVGATAMSMALVGAPGKRPQAPAWKAKALTSLAASALDRKTCDGCECDCAWANRIGGKCSRFTRTPDCCFTCCCSESAPPQEYDAVYGHGDLYHGSMMTIPLPMAPGPELCKYQVGSRVLARREGSWHHAVVTAVLSGCNYHLMFRSDPGEQFTSTLDGPIEETPMVEDLPVVGSQFQNNPVVNDVPIVGSQFQNIPVVNDVPIVGSEFQNNPVMNDVPIVGSQMEDIPVEGTLEKPQVALYPAHVQMGAGIPETSIFPVAAENDWWHFNWWWVLLLSLVALFAGMFVCLANRS